MPIVRRTIWIRWRPLILGLGLTASLGACHSEADKKPEEEAEEETPAAKPTSGQPTAVPAKVPTLSEVAGRLTAEVAKIPEADAAALAKAIKASGPDAKVLKVLYNQPQLRFFDTLGNLTEDGTAVLALLADLERHGVDKSGYRFDKLDAATKHITEAFTKQRAVLQALEKQPRAQQVATAAVQWLHGGDGGEIALVKAGGDKLGKESLQLLDSAVGPLVGAVQEARTAVWQADVEVARAAMRYLVDMQLGHPAHPIKYEAPAAIRKLTETHADKLIAQLSLSRGKVADVLRKSWPTHPQYALLLQAGDEYRKIASAGGWKPLPKFVGKGLKKGDAGPVVAALRERLHAEGYDAGEGEGFDEGLAEALATFQTRHQLEPDGVLTKTTVTELDVPVEQRVRQIGLGLQRLRESEGRDPGEDYIWVNITFQRLWAFFDGKQVETHRTVVGNNDSDTDQVTALKGKINRTKMFSFKMTRVILAPRWYPTQRVIELEIGKHLATEPDYLEKHDYVREMQPDGTEVYYQRAGKENLLGDVKFQGPNKYNIYLHDTNARALFGKARRAFSHGCIRVQDPLTLAELVLGRDKGMTPGQIRDAIKEKEEKIIQLKTPFWVHVDYVSAAVDEEGHAIFGADVYGYDQAFYDGQLPVEEAKEYKAASVRGL
jgi:murein L,D-transpeptidase YcbB/YkuD